MFYMNNEDPSLGYTIVTVLNNYSELFLIALLVVLMGVFVVIVDSFSVGTVHDLKAKLNKRILNITFIFSELNLCFESILSISCDCIVLCSSISLLKWSMQRLIASTFLTLINLIAWPLRNVDKLLISFNKTK